MCHGRRSAANAHIIPQRDDGQRAAPTVTIERMPTHLEFSSRISCNREAVCNELNRLVKMGLLKKLQNRGLQILDVPRLEQMVAEVIE